MNPPFGINWLKYHQDRDDLPHIERMGYSSFTLFQWHWSNKDACNDLIAVARKDALFLARDHPKSEEKDDQWKHDPAGKGRAHADDWAQKVKDGKVFTPIDRTYFLGLNEPNSNKYQVQIDAYNEAFCRRMTQHGLRVAAYSFGVGHPSTIDLDPKKPPDWHWYEASAAAILEGHHIVATHEYGVPENYGWGYWCGRIGHCPHPFTVVFDECGIDHGVVDGNLYGYQMYMNPLGKYCEWLDGFHVGQAERASSYKVKVHSYNIFCYDFGTSDDKDWASYDIRPIRPDLEAFKWTVVAPPAPTTPMWVNVPNGARLRGAPNTSAPVLDNIPFAERVNATGFTEITGGAQWTEVHASNGKQGWILGSLLSPTAPGMGNPGPMEPVPPPAGDDWSRVWPITLNIEGGLSTDRSDPGNYRPDGTFVGTKYGISALAHPTLDIVNLTKEQALDIYRRDYWQGSGADKLPWPLNLLHFDAYVQNEAAAKKFLAASGGDPDRYMAERIDWYTRAPSDDQWQRNSKGWMRRCATMLREASKP